MADVPGACRMLRHSTRYALSRKGCTQTTHCSRCASKLEREDAKLRVPRPYFEPFDRRSLAQRHFDSLREDDGPIEVEV
jgi:hypothetical protein